MSFLDAGGRTALTAGLRASARAAADQPLAVTTPLVLHGALDDARLAAIADADDPGPLLQQVRRDVDEALDRAFAPAAVETAVELLHSVRGCTALVPGPPDRASDPACRVRLIVPLVDTDAVVWRVHGPTGHLALHGRGAIAVVGPGTTVTVEHEGGPASAPWLATSSRLHRYRDEPLRARQLFRLTPPVGGQ